MSSPHTTLGVPLMDEDHARLDALFDALAAVSDAELPAFRAEIDTEIRAHFAREEVLMRQAGLPILHCHIAQHAMLLDELAEGVAAAAAGDMPRLRRFLGQTLAQLVAAHVDSVDRVSAGFLKGAVPAQEFAALRLPIPS